MYRKRNLLHAQCCIMLFFSQFFAKLTHGIEIYGNTLNKILHPLVITTNEAITPPCIHSNFIVNLWNNLDAKIKLAPSIVNFRTLRLSDQFPK